VISCQKYHCTIVDKVAPLRFVVHHIIGDSLPKNIVVDEVAPLRSVVNYVRLGLSRTVYFYHTITIYSIFSQKISL